MKQLLFLLLFPCLALAQYTGNAGQKITLGEQTTADGLVYRGVENDTALITPFSDTSAYIILDTVNSKFYNYNRSTNVWSVAGGSDTTSIAYVNTYGTQTVNGEKTFTSAVTATRFNPTANTATGTGMFAPATNTLGFSTNGVSKLLISPLGYISTDSISKTTELYKTFELGKGKGTTVLGGRTDGINQFVIGLNFYYPGGDFVKYIADGYVTYYLQQDGRHEFYTTTEETSNSNVTAIEIIRFTPDAEVNIGYGATDNGAYKLQVNSQIFATNATIATSDIRFKENIEPLDKGLEIINKLKPVKFNFISTTENNFSEFDEIGFIAQDVEGALSTELFAKSVVKKLDEDKDDSALGLMTEKLIPILVKAMQEQQALIKALEQRILILENK